MSETAVHSFVVRFVQEEPAAVAWRGLIRHVQSNEEIHFTQLQEAVHFIGRYVAVDQGSEKEDGRGQ